MAGENKAVNNNTGFFRPFQATLGAEITKKVESIIAFVSRNKKDLCIHRKKEVSVDRTHNKYSRSLERIHPSKATPDFPVERISDYQIGTTIVKMKELRYRCTECGANDIWMPDVANLTDIVNTMHTSLSLVVMLMDTELYFRTGMDPVPGVPSGEALITELLSATGDIARFSNAQFKGYLRDILERFTALKKALASGNITDMSDIDSSVFTGVINSAAPAASPAFPGVNGNFAGNQVSNVFMQEMVGSQPVVTTAASNMSDITIAK